MKTWEIGIVVSVIVAVFWMSSNPIKPKSDSSVEVSHTNYTVKVIDGCEYIEFDTGSLQYMVYSLTHKGNCLNPMHRCK